MRPQSASALLRGPPLTLSDIIKQGFLQRVRDLVDLGMDIDSRDTDGKTPLMLCALVEPEVWGISIARLLIENGASLKLRDKSGLNALHHACIYERYELSKVFLRAIDFDLNQTDRYGNTALHYTVKSGNISMIRLLVEYLKRYGMVLDKVNKEGMSALDIAYRMSNSDCVELLTPPEETLVSDDEEEKKDDDKEKKDDDKEKTGHEDRESDSVHLLLTESNLKSFCERNVPRRQHQRPRTALLKRRRASSVSSASSLSSGGRSQSKVSVKSTSRSKTARQVCQPNEKDGDRIIRCVSLSDFRNTKEYVFKLTAIPYDELDPDRGLPSIRRPQTAWTPRPEAVYNSEEQPFSWRTEFKKLYVEYEFQCSASWRDAAKTIADQIPLSACPTPMPPEEEEEKVRDRKGRRSSVTSKTGLSVESLKDKRRPSGNIRLRKMSTSSASGAPTPHKPSSVDPALRSSSESLNSSNSSRKKDSMINGGKNVLSPTSDKDSFIKSVGSVMQIPAVTETLVDDDDNADTATNEDTSQMDSNRLSLLSDIDEDAA